MSDPARFRQAKAFGYSDRQIAWLLLVSEEAVRAARERIDLRPTYGLVDTCAAEFKAFTPYFYSTYASLPPSEPAIGTAPRRKIMILGGGPNRIGQGIEFDYCCVHACFALRAAGFETVMINSNPETVSTDYDTSDRLYFEPLTLEDVLAVYRAEGRWGAIVQFGGQTPLNLAQGLAANGVNIIGTSPDSIDTAEDRKRFKRVLDKLPLKQPKNGIAYSVEQARLVSADLGLPLVVRPSYVLGGRAMQIIREENQLNDYLLGTLPELVPADVKARYPNDKTGQINTVLGTIRCCSTVICPTPPRSTSIACATARTLSSSASWSISRRPAFTPAISACSLPPHSLDAQMRRSRSSNGRPASLHSASTSSG